MKIANKVFVVTGGGNGIGRQLVLQLVKGGARVAIVDISEEGMKETVRLAGQLGDKISTHVADIAEIATVEALPEKIIAIHGSVDGLVNNAGIIQPFVKVTELTFAQINRVFHVNFTGLMVMTKSFLPYLLKRPEAHLVNLSSMGGFLPVPGQTIYGASKAAVKLFTEGLHSELLETNVHVTLVFPGAIKTNITVNSGLMTQEQADKQDSGKFKMTEPDKAAEMIIAGIEKNAYHVFVGNDSKMMDFLVRLAPKRAAKLIFDQMKSLLK